jgi:hypothetical protein
METRRRPGTGVADLVALEESGDLDELIVVLRERVAADRRVLANTRVKHWVGRRWRNLFLTEALADASAVAAASAWHGGTRLPGLRASAPDRRSERQQLAERFLARDVDDWRLEYPGPPRTARQTQSVVYCPSFVHNAIPLIGFADELPVIAREQNLDVIRADAHGFRGGAANAANLYDAVVHGIGSDAEGVRIVDPRPPSDVVMIGYSKGATDAYVFQGMHLELAPALRAVVNVAGPVGGSPLADDAYRLLAPMPLGLGPARMAVRAALRRVLPMANLDGLLERPDEWDLKDAVRDLTTQARHEFAREHARAIDDTDVPVFSLAGSVSPMNVPYFQAPGAMDLARRVGDNDMQVPVIRTDSGQPMSTPLAVVRAHHWDLALGSFPASHRFGSRHLAHPFPRLAALSATFSLLHELGLAGSAPQNA